MSQIQLSETQTVILTTACAREDGLIFPVTAPIKGGAVGNVCKSLLKRGLIEEIPAADPNTVWRHDEEQGPITLRATALARSTLGFDGGSTTADTDDQPEPGPAPAIGRKGTKQATLIAMLQRPQGATLQQIAEANGWQLHTARGFISGVLKKKLGLTVTSEKVPELGRIYRIQE